MSKSEYWSNGYDDGYQGHPIYDGYAVGTAAYNDYMAGYEDGATDSWNEYDAAEQEDDYDANDDGDEPDIGMQFEHDSAMTSIGWGTDEDYGYYGGDDDF
jgi:hypothetical protein